VTAGGVRGVCARCGLVWTPGFHRADIPDVSYTQDAGAVGASLEAAIVWAGRQTGGLSPGAVVCLTTVCGRERSPDGDHQPRLPAIPTSSGAARLADQDDQSGTKGELLGQDCWRSVIAGSSNALALAPARLGLVKPGVD
jgi:hypothetical protein